MAVARIERGSTSREAVPAIPTAPAIDHVLPEGGLARGAVHEVLEGEAGAAAGFACVLAARAGGTVLWLDRLPDPYPPGLLALGLPPDRLLVGGCADAADRLWAVEEGLRSGALGAVIARLDRLDLAASRRLQLAAEAGGTVGLLLRPDRARPPPSSAATRWRVEAVCGGGQIRWRVGLVRSKGGRTGAWEVGVISTEGAPRLEAVAVD